MNSERNPTDFDFDLDFAGEGCAGRRRDAPPRFGARPLGNERAVGVSARPVHPTTQDEQWDVQTKRGLTCWSTPLKKCVPAVSYSPTRPPSQYHRR